MNACPGGGVCECRTIGQLLPDGACVVVRDPGWNYLLAASHGRGGRPGALELSSDSEAVFSSWLHLKEQFLFADKQLVDAFLADESVELFGEREAVRMARTVRSPQVLTLEELLVWAQTFGRVDIPEGVTSFEDVFNLQVHGSYWKFAAGRFHGDWCSLDDLPFASEEDRALSFGTLLHSAQFDLARRRLPNRLEGERQLFDPLLSSWAPGATSGLVVPEDPTLPAFVYTQIDRDSFFFVPQRANALRCEATVYWIELPVFETSGVSRSAKALLVPFDVIAAQ